MTRNVLGLEVVSETGDVAWPSMQASDLPPVPSWPSLLSVCAVVSVPVSAPELPTHCLLSTQTDVS